MKKQQSLRVEVEREVETRSPNGGQLRTRVDAGGSTPGTESKG